jgi:DNA-binding transcriptional regulator YdaS (Cro superfamily)
MRGDMVQFDDDAEAVLRRLGINPDVVSGEDMAKLRALAAEVAGQIQRGEVSDEVIDPKLRRLIKLLSAASKSIH